MMTRQSRALLMIKIVGIIVTCNLYITRWRTFLKYSSTTLLQQVLKTGMLFYLYLHANNSASTVWSMQLRSSTWHLHECQQQCFNILLYTGKLFYLAPECQQQCYNILLYTGKLFYLASACQMPVANI
jgi:hypothetical protein